MCMDGTKAYQAYNSLSKFMVWCQIGDCTKSCLYSHVICVQIMFTLLRVWFRQFTADMQHENVQVVFIVPFRIVFNMGDTAFTHSYTEIFP